MKALVTGGAGFIGSHIAEHLCRQGATVLVLDNLSSGAVENLAWRRNGDALDFVHGDIGDDALVQRLVKGCDWVFHEAAQPSVPVSCAKPIETNRDNLESSLHLLVAARDAGVKRFMFASSAAVYGDSEVAQQTESTPPNPLSPYALQKYASERYGQLFHRLYGMETVSLRYFNVFGPRQSFTSPYSGVIAKFCTVMLEGQRPRVFGDGLQSRDFVYVENVVRANLLAAQQPADRVAGRVFNIAGGESVNLLQLIADINVLTGQSLEPAFEPSRVGDVKSSSADISAAKTDLGFDVAVSWKTGLDRTLDFYRGEAKSA